MSMTSRLSIFVGFLSCLFFITGCGGNIESFRNFSQKDEQTQLRIIQEATNGKLSSEQIQVLVLLGKGEMGASPAASKAAEGALIEHYNETMPILVASLRTDETAIMEYASKVLVNIGEPAVEPLIKATKKTWSDRVFLETILPHMISNKDKGRLERLQRIATHGRYAAIGALGQIGDEKATQCLIDLYKSEKDKNYPSLQQEALEALLVSNYPEAVDFLIEDVQKGQHIGQFDAIRLCSISKDPKLVEPLIEILNSKDGKYVYFTAANTLFEIGDPKAMEFLEAAKDSENTNLREEVRRVLQLHGIFQKKSEMPAAPVQPPPPAPNQQNPDNSQRQTPSTSSAPSPSFKPVPEVVAPEFEPPPLLNPSIISPDGSSPSDPTSQSDSSSTTIEIGDPINKVLSILGDPKESRLEGDREILTYDRCEIHLIRGQVIRYLRTN